jgi:hypothetical protein
MYSIHINYNLSIYEAFIIRIIYCDINDEINVLVG